MDYRERIDYCKETVDKLIPDYKFLVNYVMNNTFGKCNYYRKAIEISDKLLKKGTESQLKEVLFHEIAHALTEGDGHGEKWKQKTLSFGVEAREFVRYDGIAIDYEIRCDAEHFQGRYLEKPNIDLLKWSCSVCRRKLNIIKINE